MKFEQITIVFFDFGGTLFDYYPSTPEVWAKIAKRLGVNVKADDPRILNGMTLQNEAYVQLREVKKVIKFSNLTIEDWKFLDSFVLKELDLDKEGALDVAFEEFFAREGSYLIFPDCMVTLQKLKELGLRIGLISNTTPKHAHERRPMMEAHGIIEFFDVIILSSEIGFEKPHKKIFEIALKEMGIDNPKKAIHVGDCLHADVKGAQNAGLVPVLFDPLGIKKIDCVIVRALSELPELLKSKV